MRSGTTDRARPGPVREARRPVATAGGPCYHPPPAADPWCSGPTCQPVTLEIAGSNPVGSAIHPASSRAPSARPDGAPLFPRVLYAAAVSVRDPDFDPRQKHVPSRYGAHPMRPERRRPAWLIPAAIVGVVALVVVVVAAGLNLGGSGGTPSPAPSGIAEVPSASVALPSDELVVAGVVRCGREPIVVATDSPSPGPSSSPTTGPLVDGDVAIVPVTSFRSTDTASADRRSGPWPTAARRSTTWC